VKVLYLEDMWRNGGMGPRIVASAMCVGMCWVLRTSCTWVLV